jgi:hypothetical protein
MSDWEIKINLPKEISMETPPANTPISQSEVRKLFKMWNIEAPRMVKLKRLMKLWS